MARYRSVIPWLVLDYGRSVRTQLNGAFRLEGGLARDVRKLRRLTRNPLTGLKDVVMPDLYLQVPAKEVTHD